MTGLDARSKESALIKNLAWFFVANFMPKAIAFFMVPLYTFCLTTEEYGTVDILNTTVQLVLPFFTLQVQDAMLRFAMDKRTEPSAVFSVGVRIVSLGGIALVTLTGIAVACKWVALPWSYIVFFLLSYYFEAVRNIASYFCRGIEDVRTVTLANIMVTVATVVCNLLFLLAFRWGINGYLAALCAGNFVGVAILFIKAKLHRYIKSAAGDRKLCRTIIAFSIPMVFSALSWWLNTSLDKYIMQVVWGSSVVGLFAVSYKIPTVLSLFGTVFANAYSISAIKNFDPLDTDGFLGKSYSAVYSAFAIGCSALMLLNIPLARLLFSKDFFVAWKCVPPLLISALVSQMSLVCEQYYIALRKTKIISATALAGAVVNLAGNLLLIPKYAGYGAALATAVSFGTAWLARYVLLRKYIKLKHSVVRDGVMFAVLAAQMCLAYRGNDWILGQLALFAVLMALSWKEISGGVTYGINLIRKEKMD